jgi:hypothetical protein
LSMFSQSFESIISINFIYLPGMFFNPFPIVIGIGEAKIGGFIRNFKS